MRKWRFVVEDWQKVDFEYSIIPLFNIGGTTRCRNRGGKTEQMESEGIEE